MEWQISPLSRVSSWSQQPFHPGDTVMTFLLLAEGGAIERIDLHEAEEAPAGNEPQRVVLGRWKRVIKPPSDDREAQAQRLQSAEDLFLSLFETQTEDGERDEAVETREALQHFLGLHLERKKVLRAQGRRRSAGQQRYLHVKFKREFEVPVLPLDSDLVQRILPVIADLSW